MTLLRIDCDANWSAVTWDPTRPPWRSNGASEPILVTPRAALWTPSTHRAEPNPLASALLTFLQLPIRQLQGPAFLTGITTDEAANSEDAEQPVPLTPTQLRAFTSTLQTLHAMPDFLALHAQAGRIAATWFCPTATTRSFP